MLGSWDDDRGVRRRYGRCLRFRRRAVQGGDQPHSADVAGRSGREGTAGVVLSAGPHAVSRRRTWGARATVDGGTATAEMAVALPVLVLVLCGALWAAAPATSVQRSCAATQPTAQSAPQSTSTSTGSATAISAVAVPPSTVARAPHVRRRLTACGPALRTTPAVPSRPDRPATSALCGWSPPCTARRRNRKQRPYRRRTPRSSSQLPSIAAHPGPLAQARA